MSHDVHKPEVRTAIALEHIAATLYLFMERQCAAHPEASEPGSQNPPINQELLEACEAVIEVNDSGMTAAEGIRVVEMCRRAVARAKDSHA